MSVMIIDYGMGNLQSVYRTFEECGAEVFISNDPGSLKLATHIILPGVGTFSDAMKNLKNLNWPVAIVNEVKNGKPLLGICLGMQLLAEKGYENEETDGLGLIKGQVIKLKPQSSEIRIPHVGWNEVHQKVKNKLFSNIPDNSDFYFVHSYHFVPESDSNILSTTPYCNSFVSSVYCNKIFGVQFHPEKSGKFGFQVIKNFLSIY